MFRKTHTRFSALQRAEIAEIGLQTRPQFLRSLVSVLFNEPKLLKFLIIAAPSFEIECFSALQRAEIAEILEPELPDTPYVPVSVLFNEPKLLKCV